MSGVNLIVLNAAAIPCRPRMSAKERGRVMYRLADLMERDREELAQLETLVRLLSHFSIVIYVLNVMSRVCSAGLQAWSVRTS